MPPTLDLDFPLEGGEDNIVARIRAQVSLYELAIPTIVPLGSYSEEQVIAAMRKGPCIFVVYENDYMVQDTDLVGDVFQRGWRVWRVLVVCTSMRGPLEARRGVLGAYRVSDAVKKFLEGYDPVTDAYGAGEASFPLLYLTRVNAPSDDLSDYMMMMRFAHPLEANTDEMT